MTQRIDKLENLVDRQEQYSPSNCLLVHGIAKKNNENWGNLVLKKINKKLDVNITENEIDRSHRIGRKKNGQTPKPTTVNLTKYNTRQIKLKGTAVSITESLKAEGMKQLKKREKNTVLPMRGLQMVGSFLKFQM